MAITYEEMSPVAKAAFDRENNLRKIALKANFVGIGIAVIALILFIIAFIITGIKGSVPEGLMIASFVLMVPGGIAELVLGIIHSRFVIKKIWNCSPVVVFNWVIILFTLVFVLGIIGFVSVIFLIVDFVSFIQKKPLVYSFEYSRYEKMC